MSQDQPFDARSGRNLLKSFLLQEELSAVRKAAADVERLNTLAGSEERFAATTARVLHKALREARVENPERISRAIAPSVASSIKAEIMNSRDAMVEALTPIVGALVASAVKEAVDDLDAQMRAAMPFERWKAALSAKLFGGSPALRLNKAPFRVIDALAIDRQSGALLARRSAEGDDDDGEKAQMGALLAALSTFADETFAAEQAAQGKGTQALIGDALRQIRLGDQVVYVRATPASLLAVRCEGEPPVGFDARLSGVFASVVELIVAARGGDTVASSGAQAAAEPGGGVPISGLLDDLRRQSDGAAAEDPPPSPVLAVLGVAGAALVAALLWGWVGAGHEARRQAALNEQIAADPALSAYPITIERSERTDGEVYLVRGLVPDRLTQRALEARLAAVPLSIPVATDLAIAGRR